MSHHPITRITDADERSRIAEGVLRSLPQWFGIEEATAAYIKDVRELEFFAAGDEGFLAVRQHNPRAAEIHVMGVVPACHRRGIGTALLETAEAALRSRGTEYVQVKTLGPSRPSEAYAATRRFYESQEFVPLEEFDDLWPGNPALLLVKRL